MNIPNDDLYDAQRWAEQDADDDEAELMYQRMMEEEAFRAEQAAAEAEAEAAYARDAAHLDTLWGASLLCDICQEHPWTTRGVWHDAVLCTGCAEGEPMDMAHEASRAEQAAADADADAADASDVAAVKIDLF